MCAAPPLVDHAQAGPFLYRQCVRFKVPVGARGARSRLGKKLGIAGSHSSKASIWATRGVFSISAAPTSSRLLSDDIYRIDRSSNLAVLRQLWPQLVLFEHDFGGLDDRLDGIADL